MKYILLFLLLSFTIASHSQARQDPFTGTWKMESRESNDELSFLLELQVAEPEQQLLYPAQLSLTYGNFHAVYQLLLVKKQNGQLAISRDKFAVKETPFSMGTWTILLNGTMDLVTSGSGASTLQVNRLVAKRYGIAFPAIGGYSEDDRTTVIRISDFLRKADIVLKKTGQQPWVSADAGKILHAFSSPAYFGLVDTLFTRQSAMDIGFSDNNISDNDSVSISFNGKKILDQVDIDKKTPSLQLKLDTGQNILCFFADNYGRVPPNTGKLTLQFGEGKYVLDFTRKENISAGFIVAKINYFPEGVEKTTPESAARRIITEKIQSRVTKQIDSITVISSEVTLAIWDDAIEDGDSISLQINNDIFMPGIAVKKKPQFIQVKLYPGENKIFFIADNLGSIPPNTSVLEIIDGKRRKSYMINTNLGVNNSIKITYNHEAGN